jgi:hypothetical protein
MEKAKGIAKLYAWLDKNPDVCPAVSNLTLAVTNQQPPISSMIMSLA